MCKNRSAELSVIKKIKEYLKKIIKPANNPIPVDEESLKEFYQICSKNKPIILHYNRVVARIFSKDTYHANTCTD